VGDARGPVRESTVRRKPLEVGEQVHTPCVSTTDQPSFLKSGYRCQRSTRRLSALANRSRGVPSLPFAAVEDDTDIAPVLKVSVQFFVQVQTAAGHDKEEPVYVLVGRTVTAALGP
jgi:hypothetical protein